MKILNEKESDIVNTAVLNLANELQKNYVPEKYKFTKKEFEDFYWVFLSGKYDISLSYSNKYVSHLLTMAYD